jgi:hypothetical protein
LQLASGRSLKEIQEWLGHSTLATTADIYVHLDISSKLEAVKSVTWFNETALAQEIVVDGVVIKPTAEKEASSIYGLPDFLNSLFTTGISPAIIQAWLQQMDFVASGSLVDCFNQFLLYYQEAKPDAQ